MHIARVRLTNFRNHALSSFTFGDGVNALLGDNGQGKTNVLEAISYLCLTKSFYAANDAHAVRIGTPSFEVHGTFITDGGLEEVVRVQYVTATGQKLITVNGAQPESLSSIIGRFHAVILSPENNAITFGAPADRRRFMDLTLSQVSRVYFEDLMEYRKVLRHRNRLLSDAKIEGRSVKGVIDPWDTALIRYGSRIMHRRQQFVGEFQGYVERAYQDVVQNGEQPGVLYSPSATLEAGASPEAIAEWMEYDLEQRRGEELRRGLTLVGPHRDELTLQINGISAQQFASQGQHKTLLIALKVAEFFYVRERRNEPPIFLLDDVFSELDEHRSRRLLELVSGLGQTIITTTDESVFHAAVDWNTHNRRFFIEHGACGLAPEESLEEKERAAVDRRSNPGDDAEAGDRQDAV